MPTSTDLVTDLPADFEVFGQAVDTRLKALQPGTTLGDLAYSSATANTNTRLGIGSTGNILTVAGGVPTWAAPASSGSLTLLATATPSAADGVSFTSISGSYTNLYMTWENVYFDSTGDKYYYLRFNNDSGNNYSNYLFSFAGGSDAASNSAVSSTFQNQYYAILTAATGSGSPLKNGYGYLNVRNYTNTTTPKQFDYQNRSLDNNVTHKFTNGAGVYSGTSAITQIDFIRNSTQVITGTFKLWGVN
jgi:hypothetical protein